MADDEQKKKLEEEKKRKQAEIERKRAEVRARMEEASKAKKAKKGFMTPERKKKLRLLLRKKAAEELKKEQERKAAERRRIIEERCGKPKLIDDANEATLKRILKEYYDRMYICEEQKWDLEREVRKRDYEIADLNSQVNDLRGKFVKPTLKKVSKYENKFAKLQKKAAEFNFRNQLKVVKKKEFTLEEEDKEKKPDWSKKGEKEGEEAEQPAEAAPPAEGAPPTEGVPPEEGQPPTEGAPPPAEGAPPAEEGAPAEGAPPSEAAPPGGEETVKAETAAPLEGQPPAEGAPSSDETAPAPAEPAPEVPGPFETFKQLVLSENYDIVALPETIIAPTDNKDVISIPNYSLVESRKSTGEGVVLYIKDSLKYKVVDLTRDNPEEKVTMEELLERLKPLPGGAPAEGTPTEGQPAAESQPPVEGAPPAEGAPPSAETAEGTAASTEAVAAEPETAPAAETPAPEAPAAESAPSESAPSTEAEAEVPPEGPTVIEEAPPVIEAAA